jgi:hypothetical protein
VLGVRAVVCICHYLLSTNNFYQTELMFANFQCLVAILGIHLHIFLCVQFDNGRWKYVLKIQCVITGYVHCSQVRHFDWLIQLYFLIINIFCLTSFSMYAFLYDNLVSFQLILYANLKPLYVSETNKCFLHEEGQTSA